MADELKETTETEEKIEREFYSGYMNDTYNIGQGHIIIDYYLVYRGER